MGPRLLEVYHGQEREPVRRVCRAVAGVATVPGAPHPALALAHGLLKMWLVLCSSDHTSCFLSGEICCRLDSLGSQQETDGAFKSGNLRRVDEGSIHNRMGGQGVGNHGHSAGPAGLCWGYGSPATPSVLPGEPSI